MNAAGLGHVIRSLLLWEIGNVSRHGGSDDKGAPLPLPEVSSNSLGTVGSSGEVDLDDFVPVLGGRVNDTIIGGRTSTVERLLAVCFV